MIIMIIDRNVWIVRPLPHGVNRMNEFLHEDIIAIGFPTGKSFENFSSDDFKKILASHGWDEGFKTVNLFVKYLNTNDIVVVPDNNKRDIYFGIIDSKYFHEPDKDVPYANLYPHQRKVKWLFDKKPFLRSDLPDEIRGSLRYPGTIANITKHREFIENIINLENTNTTTEPSLKGLAVTQLKDLLTSQNEEIRIRAIELVMKHNL